MDIFTGEALHHGIANGRLEEVAFDNLWVTLDAAEAPRSRHRPFSGILGQCATRYPLPHHMAYSIGFGVVTPHLRSLCQEPGKALSGSFLGVADQEFALFGKAGISRI